MGNKTRQPAKTIDPKRVGNAMEKQGMQTWITRQHLPPRTGGGVFVTDGLDVFFEVGDEHKRGFTIKNRII